VLNQVPDEDLKWRTKTEPESCPSCDEAIRRTRRDEKIIDALQQARFILTSGDVPLEPSARLERVKLAINEAMRLMQPLLW
jgi:DNA polymerase II large subunit